MKRILFIFRNPPYGNSTSSEGLDLLLGASVFEFELSLAFIDDGVFQIKYNQQTDPLGLKNFSAILAALPHYGIEHIYVEQESLQKRGLLQTDLIIETKLISAALLSDQIISSDFVFHF